MANILLFCLLLIIPQWAISMSLDDVGMEYFQICESTVLCRNYSRLIIGTDHLGQLALEQETFVVLTEAVRLGINAIDTAPIYINAEWRLGHWLQILNHSMPTDACPACPLKLQTKGGFPFDIGPGTYRARLNGNASTITARVNEEIDGSISRLPNEISLYLMHRDDFDSQDYVILHDRPQTPVSTILQALSDPDLRSKFVMGGVSNWATERIADSQACSANDGSIMLRQVANSPYFSLMEMSATTTIHTAGVQVFHQDMLNSSFQPGMVIMPYSPLAGFPLFSHGWEQAKAEALVLAQNNDRYWGHVYAAIFHDANAQRYQRAAAFTLQFNIRHQQNITLDQLANAYVYAHPRVDALIIGPRSLDALHRTMMTLNIARNLTLDDLEYLYVNTPAVNPVPMVNVDDAWSWQGFNRVQLAGMAVLVALALGGACVWLYSRRRDQSQNELAMAERIGNSDYTALQ